MVPRGGFRVRALVAALAIMAQACGSDRSSPSAPTSATPLPTPSPTPTPRQTASLDSPADFIQYSLPMARITAPQAFEISVTPRRINLPYPSSFAHTFEVWLAFSNEVFANSSVGFSMSWLGNGRWSVGSYTPAGKWYYTRSEFDLQLDQTVSIRVTKHAAGIAELFVNGVSMHSIEDPEPSRVIVARVVGTATDFMWVPVGLNGSSDSTPTILPCLFCAPR